MHFEGPGQFKRRGTEVSPLSNATIKDAYMKYKGKIYPLITNTLKIHPEGDQLEIWHSFYHYDDEGERVMGRWYDYQYPVEKVKKKGLNSIRLVCDYYETWDEGPGGTAKFYFFFAEGAIAPLLA